MGRSKSLAKVNNLTQGVGIEEAASALGGWAAAAMLPGMVVKTADTTTQKWLKIGVAAGAAVGAGMVGRKFLSASAGKYMIAGGLAGVAAQAIALATGYQIGNQPVYGPVRRAMPAAPVRRVGVPQTISPATTRSDETVSLITP